MSSTDIFPKLEEIVRTLFDEYEGPATPELNAEDVEQWDSLANVQLMVLVEQGFAIRFTNDEISALTNLGALAELIERKRA